MIIVFPMLVSQSVTENAIPGIAKTVEAYLIVNHMSEIMDDPTVKRSGIMKGFRSTRKGFFAREGLVLSEDRDDIMPPGSGSKNEPESDQEKWARERREREEAEEKRRQAKFKMDQERAQRDIDKAKREEEELERRKKESRNKEIEDEIKSKKQEIKDLEQKVKDAQQAEKERRKEERDRRAEERKEEEYLRKKAKEEKERAEEEQRKRETKASAKITTRDYKSISLEPSYIEVEVTLPSGATEKRFIGIKVVPYRVISSEKLSRLILHDVQVNTIQALMISVGRASIRGFWRFFDKWIGRLRGGITVTGDPRRDILMARTGKNTLGIIVLSKNEDIDERFLQNIPRINRLFKMGWGNIIIADDVSRQAYFCMRGYTGTCQVMNYAMMYQNLGQLKVYDSLEDAQRQNSSLFKVSKKASKVFSEWVTENRLLKYYKSEEK